MMSALVISGSHGAFAQYNGDPLWNPRHISVLPADVQAAVKAICHGTASAGHYFATFNREQINLHFEHLHCGDNSFCNGATCLHQVYKLTNGHYRLAKSFYGSGDD